VIKKVIEALYEPNKYFDTEDMLNYKALHPEIFHLNKHIQRNEGYAKSLQKEQTKPSKS
jgi:hypothetical protein